jgi:hypothetical protein
MTDDELKSVGRVIGAFSSGSYAQGFEAGYRAGLENRWGMRWKVCVTSRMRKLL